jgi:hypothetical protein
MTVGLLNNAYAPVTFTVGFIETPFKQLSDAFVAWRNEINRRYEIETKVSCFEAPLSKALLELEPLTTPLDRYLIIETQSPWTAIFSNGLRVNDVDSPVAYLPTVLNCRGLHINNIPDRSSTGHRDALRIWGAVTFTLYGPEKTDWLNRIRHISLTNDVGGWEFVAEGEIQSFEQVENYKKRRLKDRFTPKMVESYCAALGIRVFDAEFYSGNCVLSRVKRSIPPGPSMSIAEAKAHLYL